jgi:hypothetical protein
MDSFKKHEADFETLVALGEELKFKARAPQRIIGPLGGGRDGSRQRGGSLATAVMGAAAVWMFVPA